MNDQTQMFKVFGSLAWTITAIAGFIFLVKYSQKAGGQGAASAAWPDAAGFSRAGRPTLLMFVHPKCSCSRASLGEMERLIAAVKTKADIKIVFYGSDKMPHEWVLGANWDLAQALPFSEVLVDRGSRLAHAFGAKTSGHTLLYDDKGALVFSGGITPARGHMGDSPGRAAILSYFNHSQDIRPEAPVFGCDLGKIAAIQGGK